MKKLIILAFALVIILPTASEAKTNKPKGYERARGSSISVSQPLGWPVSVSAKVGKLDGSIESLPGMAIIRVKAYKSWYNVLTTIPATTTLSIRGLPANKELHIYTNGYRVHETMTTSPSGTLSVDRPTGRGMQVIIKEKPSTYHIQVGGFINPAGGDCSAIGAWNATTKTCTLNQNITSSIVVEDASITINGNGHSSTGAGAVSGDAVFTDQSSVTIKNLNISNYARGVVFADTFLSIAPSGGVADTISVSQTPNAFVIDDIPGVHANKVTVTGGNTGIRLTDTTDIFFSTNDLQFTNGRVTGAQDAVQFEGIEGVLLQGNTFNTNTHAALTGTIDGTVTAYQNNFKNNTADFSGLSGTIVWQGTVTQRGNYWSRNGAGTCTQSGNTCTNSFSTGYGTDAYPWACENAWVPGVVCPVVPPATGSRWGEIHSSAGTAKLYSNAGLTTEVKTLPNEWALLVIDPASNPVQVKDVTDDTVGYLRAADITITPAGSARETELRDNASHIYDTRSARVPVILDAVSLYYDNVNGTGKLYNPAGGLDNNNDFQRIFTETNFPKEVILGIIADETGSVGHALNNELCNDDLDGGVGVIQMTSNDFKGKGSGLKNTLHLNDCDSSSGWTLPTSSYYSNTFQGIHANIKDGFRVIQEKFNARQVQTALATTSSSFFSKDGLTINKRDMGSILTVRAFNGFGTSTVCKRLNVYNEYPGNVGRNMLELSTFFPGYTYSDSTHGDIARKLILANENKEEIYTCSPVYLQVLNTQHQLLAGYTGLSVINNTDRIIYDEETKRHAAIIFPDQQYIYRVVGLADGTYDLVRNKLDNGELKQFSAIDIPVKNCSVHEYKVINNEVELRADQDCNGTFETVINFSTQLSSTTFNGVAVTTTKVAICHRPPGNPGNAHTITVGEPAVRAHMAHGDTMGACGPTTATTTSVRIPPGQAKKELNSAPGGFVPPGQAKKNKK